MCFLFSYIFVFEQRAKREVAKFSGSMVSSKQAWAEIQEMRRKDDMMRRQFSFNPFNLQST